MGGIESTDYPGCYYRTVDGVVEWFNPPMVIGKAYRTTERYVGNPVYIKTTDFGSLPNNSSKEVGGGAYIGPNGEVLSYKLIVVDSTDATGYRWVAPKVATGGQTEYDIEFDVHGRANHYVYMVCTTHRNLSTATGVAVFKFTQSD